MRNYGMFIIMILCLNGIVGTVSLSLSTQSSSSLDGIRFRQGKWQDLLTINVEMIKSLSSFSLLVESQEFIIAQQQEDDAIVGWGQLRLLGPAATDPNNYDATTTTTPIDLEKEADELMWEQFEEDTTIEFPNGWSSLPWTKEYKRVAQAAEMKRIQRSAILERERQEAGQSYELTSIYVQPSYRHRGIATHLIQTLLSSRQRQPQPTQHPSYSYVLTRNSNEDWYRQFGFESIDETNIPPSLKLKYFSTNFLNNNTSNDKVVCMRTTI